MQREVKHRFDMAKKELESMKYHPLRDYKLMRSGDQVSNAKRKKLKTSIKCKFTNISHFSSCSSVAEIPFLPLKTFSHVCS